MLANAQTCWAVALLLVASSAYTADADLESLDDEFLAYLAEFEGAEDDWTIVEAQPTKPASTTASPAQPAQKAPLQANKPKATPPVAAGSKP